MLADVLLPDFIVAVAAVLLVVLGTAVVLLAWVLTKLVGMAVDAAVPPELDHIGFTADDVLLLNTDPD